MNTKTKAILLILISGAFFAVLNETLLTVALNKLSSDFNISLATASWVTTVFLLVMGVITPLSANLINRFSTRTLYLSTMLSFVAGSLVGALSANFGILLMGRILQAVSAGLLVPLMFTVILQLIPAEQRGKIMGIITFTLMIGPAIGPSISGIIVGSFGWRGLFWVTIPFIFLNLLMAYKFLPNIGETTKHSFDVPSFIFSGLGFAGFLYATASFGEGDHATFTPLVLTIVLIISLVLLSIFIKRQSQLDNPYLNLKVLNNKTFRTSSLVYLLVTMFWLFGDVALPMYLQNGAGYDAKTVGLMLFPGAFLGALLAPTVGKLFDKFGPKKLVLPAAIALLVIGLSFTFFLNPTIGVSLAVILLITRLLAISFANTPAQTNALNTLEPVDYAHGSAVISTLQPIAGAVSISVGMGVINSIASTQGEKGIHAAQALTSGVQGGFIYASALALVAVLIATKIKRA